VTLELPSRLVESVAEDSSSERKEWLAGLPGVVRGLAARWSLTVGPPFQPGGEVSWVAPARDEHGRELVLKVGWRHVDSDNEAAGLRAWQGCGAVEVYDSLVEGTTSALLLQRCRPGTTLAQLRTEHEQDEVVAALLRDLWHEPPPGHPFRPLPHMCAEWAAEFDALYAADPGGLDPGLVRAGTELFRTLALDYSGPQLLLVTDLHAGNILADGDRWLLIDPKPHVGDPCYDVLQHMLNVDGRLRADPLGLADRMAGLLDLDAERVRLWLFARAVVECFWMRWLRPLLPALAP
jgi:streptomycin 6-kinase